jgi:hypothetical protein
MYKSARGAPFPHFRWIPALIGLQRYTYYLNQKISVLRAPGTRALVAG